MIIAGYGPTNESVALDKDGYFYYLSDFDAPKSSRKSGSAQRAMDELNRMLTLGKDAYKQKLVSPSYGYLAGDMSKRLDYQGVYWNENPSTSRMYREAKKLVAEMNKLWKTAKKEGLNP